jgi:hypothetical protein
MSADEASLFPDGMTAMRRSFFLAACFFDCGMGGRHLYPKDKIFFRAPAGEHHQPPVIFPRSGRVN